MANKDLVDASAFGELPYHHDAVGDLVVESGVTRIDDLARGVGESRFSGLGAGLWGGRNQAMLGAEDLFDSALENRCN